MEAEYIEGDGAQALLHYFDKKTGKKSRRPPQFAKKGKYNLDSFTFTSSRPLLTT
jgi:phage-related protein